MNSEIFIPMPETKIKLYIRNMHMFNKDILFNILKKIDLNKTTFTADEIMALYGLVRNQYIYITDHDY